MIELERGPKNQISNAFLFLALPAFLLRSLLGLFFPLVYGVQDCTVILFIMLRIPLTVPASFSARILRSSCGT